MNCLSLSASINLQRKLLKLPILKFWEAWESRSVPRLMRGVKGLALSSGISPLQCPAPQWKAVLPSSPSVYATYFYLYSRWQRKRERPTIALPE